MCGCSCNPQDECSGDGLCVCDCISSNMTTRLAEADLFLQANPIDLCPSSLVNVDEVIGCSSAAIRFSTFIGGEAE